MLPNMPLVLFAAFRAPALASEKPVPQQIAFVILRVKV